MPLDFTDTDELLDRIMFYLQYDIHNENDMELLSEVIYEIKNKKNK